MSTLVLGWIFPVALTFCTIFCRSALAVWTAIGLWPPGRATMPATRTPPHTTPAVIHQCFFRIFIAIRPPRPFVAKMFRRNAHPQGDYGECGDKVPDPAS